MRWWYFLSLSRELVQWYTTRQWCRFVVSICMCVYIRCENTMRPNIIFLCFFVLIQIYVQHTTESFATPKEKLLAEFNLAECCSFRLCDFGRRTFSKMHANHSKRTNTTMNMNIHFECVATKWGSQIANIQSEKKSLCRRDSFDVWQHNNFRNYISLIKLFY